MQFPQLSVSSSEQRFSNISVELDRDEAELDSFAKAQAISIDSVLRLAWGLVLRAFTGSQHVCFGYQSMGRHASIEGARHAVGSFANIVPCTYDLSATNSVSECIQLAVEQLEESLDHQHFTIPELHHAIGLKGDERLFNTCLTFTEELTGLKSKFAAATRPSSGSQGYLAPTDLGPGCGCQHSFSRGKAHGRYRYQDPVTGPSSEHHEHFRAGRDRGYALVWRDDREHRPLQRQGLCPDPVMEPRASDTFSCFENGGSRSRV